MRQTKLTRVADSEKEEACMVGRPDAQQCSGEKHTVDDLGTDDDEGVEVVAASVCESSTV